VNQYWNHKSPGHLAFSEFTKDNELHGAEYFQIGDDVYYADRDEDVDPDGYRYGTTRLANLKWWRENWVQFWSKFPDVKFTFPGDNK
jgi:hypothetical protein